MWSDTPWVFQRFIKKSDTINITEWRGSWLGVAGEQHNRMGNQQASVVHKMAHWHKEKRWQPPVLGSTAWTPSRKWEDKSTHTHTTALHQNLFQTQVNRMSHFRNRIQKTKVFFLKHKQSQSWEPQNTCTKQKISNPENSRGSKTDTMKT